MPFASTTFPEQYEGMLVRFPQTLVIAEYFTYDQFGEIVLALPLAGEDRPLTPVRLRRRAGRAGRWPAPRANAVRRITLDDNQGGSNPATLRHPNGNPFSLANMFRGGDRRGQHHRRSGLRLQPLSRLSPPPRPTTPRSTRVRLRLRMSAAR
jgi:predicted extracellular nuclease